MLKKICGLFLGLVVLASSACVTPTHASSASPVIITSIQAAGPSGARDESIVLYNQSDAPVNITDWCLSNKVDSFVCFSKYQSDYPLRLTIPPHGYVTVVSEYYSQPTPILLSYASLTYGITNQTTGRIVGSADTISLLNASWEVMDSFSWTASPPTGKGWARTQVTSNPDVYAHTGSVEDWGAAAWRNLPASALISELPPISEEPEELEEPEEPEEPTDPQDPGSGNPNEPETPGPSEPAKQTLPVIITELFPNPVGSDTGNEFIELFNPNTTDLQLPATTKLRIGSETFKWVTLPSITIPAKQYYVLSNKDISFTLVNSSGAVALYDNNSPIGEVVPYSNIKEGQSWALVDGGWIATNQPSPGAANIAPDEQVLSDDETVAATSTQKPCAANQFRNPETGRCKRITVATTPTPCKAGQERNPETNRCRTIVAASVPTPCKPGQERNAETNRCRAVKAMTSAGFGIGDVQQTAGAQLQWYYLAAIGGIVLLILGYAAWEWRQELTSVWKHVKAMFIKHPS